MKKALVSGYIGFDNFGDEAIFYALSNHLKENDFKVSALCNNKEKTAQKYNVETYYFKSLKDILKAIVNTDILISGGGSLLQNKTSNFSLFYYLTIILLAKLFFKKVIIFSQGIEPIKGFIPTIITKNILKMVDFISVRDENSLELINSWNLKASLTSDPVYSLVQEKEMNKNKKDIVVQLRSFEGINDEFLSNLAQALQQTTNQNIKVFSFQDEYDKDVCVKFTEKLKEINIKAEFVPQKTINETIEIIDSSDFVISTRFHGALIAHALNSSTFALSYDDKIKNLAYELNIPQIDICNYSLDELKDKLNIFFNKQGKTKEFRKYQWSELDKQLRS